MSKKPNNSPQWPLAPDVRHATLSLKHPLVKDGMRLPPPVEALPMDQRPMIWTDLPVFEARHGRCGEDMVYDLALHLRSQYARLIRTPVVVPFDIELLVHLYDRYPSSCAWKKPTLRQVFEMVYGPAIDALPEEWQALARSDYGARFSRLMGRSTMVHYRWLVDETSLGKSGATRRIKNIIAKLAEAQAAGESPRELLESITVPMWLKRGLDIDRAAPAPDVVSLSQRRRRRIRPRVARVETVYQGGAFLALQD